MFCLMNIDTAGGGSGCVLRTSTVAHCEEKREGGREEEESDTWVVNALPFGIYNNRVATEAEISAQLTAKDW